MNKKTLVIGASIKSERYSNKAIKMLKDNGHEVVALSKKSGSAHGIDFKTEYKLFEDIDTVSIYISPKHQHEIIDYVLSLKPSRVIFNPGTENIEFSNLLRQSNISVENACTLVLLRLGSY